MRIPAAAFRDLLGSSEPLRRLLERYTLTVIRQSGQMAACNLRHPVIERMARWLLMTRDRVDDDEFLARFYCVTAISRMKVMPVFKMVDTCAGEFESQTPYYYGTFEQEDDALTPTA